MINHCSAHNGRSLSAFQLPRGIKIGPTKYLIALREHIAFAQEYRTNLNAGKCSHHLLLNNGFKYKIETMYDT